MLKIKWLQKATVVIAAFCDFNKHDHLVKKGTPLSHLPLQGWSKGVIKTHKTFFLFGCLLLAIFLIELLNPARRVNQLLLAGEKRMAG